MVWYCSKGKVIWHGQHEGELDRVTEGTRDWRENGEST